MVNKKLYLEIKLVDESEEYALADEAVNFFEWDSETQKATDLPRSLFLAAPELLSALKEVVRYCEALRYTAGMGPNQLKRLENAKAIIAKAEREKRVKGS